MRHEEIFYMLALQRVNGIGYNTAKDLLSHFKTATSIFKASRDELLHSGLRESLLTHLRDDAIFKEAESELKQIESRDIKCTLISDADYPSKLLHCPDGPLVLFSTGNIGLVNRRIISIVGTRRMTPYGAECCKKLIADLAPLNPVIVSGFAYGVDIAAHVAALENNLQTIAVLGSGLGDVYPKTHRKYISAINKNGGFFTEFGYTAPPLPDHFVRRNRIVAGMSEATIIIESANKGGSLITANIASDYNRDVFAFPGRASDIYSQGCNRLIKTQKAQLLTDAADLIYHLNWDLNQEIKPVQSRLFVNLAPEEQKTYDYLLEKQNQSLDEIALGCELPISKTSAILLSLELKGVVQPLPGKNFKVI